MSRFRARLTGHATVGVIVSLAIVGSSPALAGGGPPPPPPDKATGKIGDFGWAADTEASPAGRCRYGFTVDGTYYNYLNALGVDGPLVYARRNRTKQRIGFRLTLQRFDGERWVRGKRSDWAFKRATPSDPAPFRARTVSVPFELGSVLSRRAKVQLRWYGRGGHGIVGKATMFPDWYEASEMGTTHSQAERCGGTTG